MLNTNRFQPKGFQGRSAWVLVTLALLLAATSCGKIPEHGQPPPATSSTTTTLAQQAQINVAVPYLPSNFNPVTPAGDTQVTRAVMAGVWPSAFYVDSRFQPVLDSGFLNSAELVSTNPETVVYEIKPQARWSDGVAISASDFIYNWEAQRGGAGLLEPGGAKVLANSTIGYSDIKSVTGSNNGKTVTVVFRHYFSEWEALFSPLVPAHVSQRVGWNSGFTKPSPLVEVSGGPYEISTFIPGRLISLVRNPRYWGRKASLGTINFVVDPDPSLYPNQFQNSIINLVHTPAHSILYSDLSSLVGVKTLLVPSLVTEELVFNLTSAPFNDFRLRKAVALAIDRSAITDYAIGSYVPEATPAGNNIFPKGIPQYQNDGQAYMTSDVSGARSLLGSAGYTLSSAGQMEKNGIPLKVRISVDSSDQQLLLVEQLIIRELGTVGITAVADNYSAGTLQSSILPSHKFDMAIVAQKGSQNASFEVQRYSSAGVGAGYNYSGYSSSQADSLMAKAASELDPGTSAGVYNQLDKLIWKDLPSIPLYSVPDILAYDSGYFFIGQSSGKSTVFWNASSWTYRPRSGK